MNITVYLPDEIGRWAKDAQDLDLSALLRTAVEREREYRDWLAEPASDIKAHELRVEGDNGTYTVRLHAKEIARNLQRNHDEYLYVTEDERVLVYDNDADKLYGFDPHETSASITYTDAAHWEHGDPDFYLALMQALGEDAVIDIGRAR